MSTATCPHPHCHAELERYRVCCKDHWRLLNDDQRRRSRQLKTPSDRGAFAVELREYFEDRLVGDNDISTCKYCGRDVIWIDGRFGRLPVEVDGVEASDTAYDKTRHTRHQCSEYAEARHQGRL